MHNSSTPNSEKKPIFIGTMASQWKHKISLNLFLSSLVGLYRNYFQVRRSRFGYIDPSARVRYPILIKGIENVFLHENSHIMGHSLIITTCAKFILMRNSAAAEGLTVVTGNHPSKIGEWFYRIAADDIQTARDIIVEEDVWLGSHVTLLSGTSIGRGSIIGSGAVCRSRVPPYAITAGNPAKIVGFRFLPEEILEHEKGLYCESERIEENILIHNYKTYFLDRANQIRQYLSTSF
jgi:acetyltransferase-like isoleucine patch superfamily enzyme